MPVGHWGCRAGTVIDAEPCSQVSCDAACSRTQATTGDPRHESESAYVIWGQDCQSDSDPFPRAGSTAAATPCRDARVPSRVRSIDVVAAHGCGTCCRDVADDPMLLELVASIPVTRTAKELAMGPLSPVRAVAASSEDGAPRPSSSPARSCAPQHGDGPPSDPWILLGWVVGHPWIPKFT